MNSLYKNCVLKNLNLSWNALIDSKNQKEKSSYIYPDNIAKFFNRKDYEMTHTELLAHRFSYLIG